MDLSAVFRASREKVTGHQFLTNRNANVWRLPVIFVWSRERGRLDRSRRRPADEPVALDLAHQPVSGICRTELFGETPSINQLPAPNSALPFSLGSTILLACRETASNAACARPSWE